MGGSTACKRYYCSTAAPLPLMLLSYSKIGEGGAVVETEVPQAVLPLYFRSATAERELATEHNE
jgi:hypothetical protein